MARVLFIDDAKRDLSVKTARDILRFAGHDDLGATWDKGVFGSHPGTIKLRKPADFIVRMKPDVVFIHFGTNLDVASARQVIEDVTEKLPDCEIVVLTNVDPDETFGATYSLRIPFDPEDMLDLID